MQIGLYILIGKGVINGNYFFQGGIYGIEGNGWIFGNVSVNVYVLSQQMGGIQVVLVYDFYGYSIDGVIKGVFYGVYIFVVVVGIMGLLVIIIGIYDLVVVSIFVG